MTNGMPDSIQEYIGELEKESYELSYELNTENNIFHDYILGRLETINSVVEVLYHMDKVYRGDSKTEPYSEYKKSRNKE